LTFTSQPVVLGSFNNAKINSEIVYVGYNSDPLKTEQGLVKIILNCLLYYFPDIRDNKSLNLARRFVQDGQSELKRSFEKKNNIIDRVEKSHNVFFQQHNKNLSIRISLFNGQTSYRIIIEDLQILPNMTYNRLVIDYSKRINNLESNVDFFRSFDTIHD
jgi:hypothetical protein